MREPDEALRAAYLATTWSVRTPGGTLRLAPGRPAPPPLRPAAVVTTYNPLSRPTAAAANRAALRRLCARLAAPWLPARAHGTGPGRHRWSEPGVALLGPSARAAALALGVEWRQNAVLAVGGDGRVEVVAARAGFCGRRPGEAID